VDNCSTDNSFNLLAKLSHPKLVLIKSSFNKGYGFGNNIGLTYCINELKSDFAIIANPDVLMDEVYVSKTVEFLVTNKNYGIASALMVNKEGVPSLSSWPIPKPHHIVVFSSSILSRFYDFFTSNKRLRHQFAGRDDFGVVAGSLLTINLNHFHKVGGFEESIFLYNEENILAIKFKEKNIKTKLLTDVSYKHFHSVSIRSAFKRITQRRRLAIKSKKITLEKYYKLNLFYKLFLFILLDFLILESYFIDFFYSIFLFLKIKLYE
jgi:GT2 family glycosyltransferase